MYRVILVFAVITLSSRADLMSTRQGSFNRYYVYSRDNQRNPIELDITATNLNETISPARNTSVVIHGHRGSATTSLNPTVKDAFLVYGDLNVIVVDWSVYASQSYSVATGAVPSVGSFLGDLIDTLVTAEVVTLETLHLVGFDLGAHIAGFAGRGVNGTIARITGLSPAAKNWGTESSRLNRNDAAYVEVIHTDSGGLFGHGVSEAIGDVDFFVNGGIRQPGCPLNPFCSHNRAWEVFAATLTHNHLIGNQCGNMHQVSLNQCRGYLLRMGNNEFDKFGTGMFRVNTRRTYPF